VRLGDSASRVVAISVPAHAPLDITDFLDAVARDVRSGFSLSASIVQCSDRQQGHDSWSEPIAQRLLRGVTLSDALTECALPTWSPEIRFASRTLAVASAGGSGVAPALEHSASVLREQHGLALDRDIQSAQAQLSTKVLTWLPIAVFAWICATDPFARLFLLSTPAGMGCIATGITLNVCGRKWMSRVVSDISV
jgi:tight adherence protein B